MSQPQLERARWPLSPRTIASGAILHLKHLGFSTLLRSPLEPAMSAAQLEAQNVLILEIDSIEEDPNNPRRTYDPVKLQELADSIKKTGLLQPIVVKEFEGRHRVIFGHRRRRAAKLAGKTHIEALLRNMTDQEILEAQVVENGQREDPHPLEEAEGYNALMVRYNLTVETIAAKVGKSASYVYSRLGFAKLTEKCKEAFYGDLPLSLAVLLARIPRAELQDQALGKLRGWNDDGWVTANEARQLIRQNFMLLMKDAPFDLKDEFLVDGVPSCVKCPKRTCNQKELFADVAKEDLCTDGVCWAKKKDQSWANEKAKAEAKGHQVIEGKAAEKAYKWGYLQDTSLVELDKKVPMKGGEQTLKKALGKDVPQVLVRDGNGVVHYLVQRDVAIERLKEKDPVAAKDLEPYRFPTESEDYKKKEKAQKEKEARAEEVRQRAMAKVVANVEGGALKGAELWALLARAVVGDSFGELEPVFARRGVKEKQFVERFHVMTEEGLRGFVVEALLWKCADGYGEETKVWESACKKLGVDLKAIDKEVATEAKKPSVNAVAAAAVAAAARFKLGDEVKYRQGRGEFVAKVIDKDDDTGMLTLERVEDGKKVERPADKVS